MAFPPISILRKERPLKMDECGHTYSHGVQRFGTFCPIGWVQVERDKDFQEGTDESMVYC